MSARRITIRVQPPNPFGEVTMVLGNAERAA